METSSRRVLIVSHYYPPHIGGIERVAEKQAIVLAKKGHFVTVVTSRVSKNEHSGFIDGVHVVRVNALNLTEKFGVPFPIFSPRLILELARRVKNADVVHIHDAFYLSSFTVAVCARWYQKPIVLMQHVAMVNHPNPFVMFAQKLVYATTGAFIFASASRIITLNNRVEQFLVTCGVAKQKLTILYNGVDSNFFHPVSIEEKEILKKKYHLATDKKIVLFIGRFVAKKGFSKLLAAQSNEYQLVFVGGTIDSHTGTRAVFLGKLSPGECAEVYQAADVFVLPSEGEGFPLSIQEAMASGLPIVTTNDPGYACYNFNRKFLTLLDDTGSESLKVTISAITKDDTQLKQMSEYSLAYAKEHFDWVAIISSLESLYEKIIAEKQTNQKKIISYSDAVFVTTSWDDGHQLDIKLATLLQKYGIKGTFYIAPNDHESAKEEWLSNEQIALLSNNFEIGAHTMSHRSLLLLPNPEAEKEIIQSKSYLEGVIGNPVISFCYPLGQYNMSHVQMVRNAGFVLARTVRRFSYKVGENLHEMPTTIHTYDHWLDILGVLRLVNWNPILFLYYYRDWSAQAKAMFDSIHKKGGVFHLWGHSWEIDGHQDWERLEDVLSFIGNKEGVHYVVNKELA